MNTEIIEMVAEGVGIAPQALQKAIKNKTPLQHALIDYGFHLASLKQSEALNRKRGCDEYYNLDCFIWKRRDEWILEITGSLNDTHFTCRHAEPISTPLEDVAGLPSYFRALEVAKDAISMAIYHTEKTTHAPAVCKRLKKALAIIEPKEK